MTSEEDWREVEQLQREAEELKSYLERSDITSEEKLERAIEVRARHQKIISERRRNRPRVQLPPLPPLLLRQAGAVPTTAKGEIMTYEQMETTMQFILQQQAASAEWQKRFEENLARINGTLAASAEWQKQFEESFARNNAASAEWQKRFEENIAQINGTLAASARWQEQAGENFGSLMGDVVGYSAIFENINIEIEKLTDRLSTVGEHLTILTENVNTLSATVKNMIQGGTMGTSNYKKLSHQ